MASTTAAAQFDFAAGKSATMHSKTSFKGSVVFTLRGGGGGGLKIAETRR